MLQENLAETTAIVLGASGSVGGALLAEIARSGGFGKVIVITRRPLNLQLSIPVNERHVPNMAPGELTPAVVDALHNVAGEVVGFSVLGVGAGTAKLSLEEHRAVDVELNAAFARGLRYSGKVEHLAFMSAIGADATAGTSGSGAPGMARYSRVKGEAEAAVQSQGPAVVSIFRPSLIIGSQHTPRVLEAVLQLFSWLTPAKFRSIRTTEIAQAMVATALRPPSQSAVFENRTTVDCCSLDISVGEPQYALHPRSSSSSAWPSMAGRWTTPVRRSWTASHAAGKPAQERRGPTSWST